MPRRSIRSLLKKRSKKKRNIGRLHIHIHSTFNNTIITVTDDKGDVLDWASAGTCGFKGSKKSTAYAAQVASQSVADRIKRMFGTMSVDVYVRGAGAGRESAIRVFQMLGYVIERICDATCIPHNGCRPRKRRRI